MGLVDASKEEVVVVVISLCNESPRGHSHCDKKEKQDSFLRSTELSGGRVAERK